MWVMKVVGFQVRMSVGFLPDSIVIISCVNTEGWSLTEQGRGFKSCSLVGELSSGKSSVSEELIVQVSAFLKQWQRLFAKVAMPS